MCAALDALVVSAYLNQQKDSRLALSAMEGVKSDD